MCFDTHISPCLQIAPPLPPSVLQCPLLPSRFVACYNIMHLESYWHTYTFTHTHMREHVCTHTDTYTLTYMLTYKHRAANQSRATLPAVPMLCPNFPTN
jgi:hypothetical protein